MNNTPTPRTPKISFVIPAFNEERYIGDCLRSIIDLGDPAVHEIIVVDNGSTDKTAEIAHSIKGVTVVSEPLKGLPRARQRGFSAATGDLYAAIDADTRLTPQWIDAVKKQFGEHPEIACLIGFNKYYDMTERVLRTKRHLKAIRRFLFGTDTIKPPQSPHAEGGNTVYSMRALRSIGGFNPDISFYGEDVDVMLRIASAGNVVHDPGMLALSSARRMNAEGVIATLVRYKINSIWQKIMRKPLLGVGKDWR